mmetsp:Transcript_14843/g.17175  ORF Transcript_14843/g.17175 Transcript_14843/m.17175 type:complete len:179 (-) Transcript_14843:27-563(-)
MRLALLEIMKEKEKNDAKALEEAKVGKLSTQIKKCGIKMGKKLHYLPEDIGAQIYIDGYNIIHFPVILLYEEFMQSDFIQDFPMNTTFREQLSIVLSQPAPWDPDHRYKLDAVDIFFETNISEPVDPKQKVVESDDRYTKVDLDSNLLSVLQDSAHIVPQYPIFVVVARDYHDYKKFT